MKVTIMNAIGNHDLLHAARQAMAYIAAGYADGSRPKQRHCVIFGRRGEQSVAVWGGPDHIRVQYARLDAVAEKEG